MSFLFKNENLSVSFPLLANSWFPSRSLLCSQHGLGSCLLCRGADYALGSKLLIVRQQSLQQCEETHWFFYIYAREQRNGMKATGTGWELEFQCSPDYNAYSPLVTNVVLCIMYTICNSGSGQLCCPPVSQSLCPKETHHQLLPGLESLVTALATVPSPYPVHHLILWKESIFTFT